MPPRAEALSAAASRGGREVRPAAPPPARPRIEATSRRETTPWPRGRLRPVGTPDRPARLGPVRRAPAGRATELEPWHASRAMRMEPRARRAAGRPALVVPTGQDVPLTVLVTAETAPSRSLQTLASRMAVHLGHGVQPWHPLERATALAAIGRRIARGTVRLVVLPVSAGQDAARVGSAVDEVATTVFRRWPSVRVHRGISPGVDDLARLLGDRGREAAGTLGLKRSALGAAVAVIVDVEGQPRQKC